MFYQLIAKPLEWFYGFWPNYAGAIGLLTMLIMIVLLPLTLKGTRSMLAMQKLQPEMKKLQAKHRDDRQKLNEEMMKFYKENNINPVSGCMPLLLQTPVFFFLYRTLYQLLNRAPYGQDMGAAVARQARGRVYEQFGNFQPSHLSAGSKLYRDLSHTRQMRSFGFDLAESAVKAVSKGPGHAFPFIVLVLIVTATSFIQQRQISARTPQTAQSNPQQAMMMKIVPLFLSVISLTLPAGIVVYFVVSNVFRIGQQALITRTMYADEDGTVATTGREVDTSSAEKPKGFLAQLREAGLPDPGQARRSAAGSDAKKGTATKTKPKPSSARAAASSPAKTKTTSSGTAKQGGAASPGTPGKSSGTKGVASKGGTTKRPAPQGPAPKGASTEPTAGSTGSSAAAPSARPSRSAPSAPNRARNKKKRK